MFSVITCDSPRVSPTNGSVECSNSNKLGSRCTYSCDSRFGLSDLRLAETTCNDDGDKDANGAWSTGVPECLGMSFKLLRNTDVLMCFSLEEFFLVLLVNNLS